MCLATARRSLPDYPEIRIALDELEDRRWGTGPVGDTLAFDLADLRGYHYHSGMVFAAYASSSPNAIALGGRYDEVGKAFGRARPATGLAWTCGNSPVWYRWTLLSAEESLRLT